jgi:L-lactate dehydrogenase
VVLIDRTRARARAVAADLHYGASLCPEVTRRDGDYADLAAAGLVMLTAGVNEKRVGATDRNDREGRLKLLDTDVGVFMDMVPNIVKVAPEAVLLIVTDPPDPLADVTRRLAGHDRVLSTGTLLDSLRFRVHLAEWLKVSPASVEAQVVGEHGTSET